MASETKLDQSLTERVERLEWMVRAHLWSISLMTATLFLMMIRQMR